MAPEAGQPAHLHKLSDAEIEEFIGASPGWTYADQALHCTRSFPTYLDGLSFVQQVGIMAEEAGHHPDLLLRWRKVEVTLSSHDAGGVTSRDVNLARRIDAVAPA